MKIRLIASENYVSDAVLAATGSVLTNKYSEGYPGKRYYEGQQFVDPVESLAIDFEAFAEIAREAGARFAADMAHIAGLVAGGVHASPVPWADVVTTTTHKTLRGPRGAMILAREEHATAIDRAIFPGLQGGPHNHTTAAIAVALREAARPEFAVYARRVVENARVLAEELAARGFELVSGGTDTHLILVDLTNKDVPGRDAARALDDAGLETNFNTVPFDPRKPLSPSGLRLGTAAVTSRGMGRAEMRLIAGWIDRVVSAPADPTVAREVRGEVEETSRSFPPPGIARSPVPSAA